MSPPPQALTTARWAAAARIAGAVLALGYLVGVAQGPVVAVAGALALMTFGRALGSGRLEGVFSGAALAIVVGTLGVASLRWGALDLDGIRGVQAFFGPTLLVEPVAAATAAWLAAGAGALSLGLWLGAPARTVWPLLAWISEAMVGSLALVSAFWGEAIVGWGGGSGSVWSGVGEWAAATTVTALVSALVAVAGSRVSLVPRWIALGLAGFLVPVSALITASAVTGVV